MKKEGRRGALERTVGIEWHDGAATNGRTDGRTTERDRERDGAIARVERERRSDIMQRVHRQAGRQAGTRACERSQSLLRSHDRARNFRPKSFAPCALTRPCADFTRGLRKRHPVRAVNRARERDEISVSDSADDPLYLEEISVTIMPYVHGKKINQD